MCDFSARVRMGCTKCPWSGQRVYQAHDNLAGKPAGFGVCPKCGAALQRIVKHLHHVRKAS